MNTKAKVILKAPIWGWRNHRSRSLAKKILKYEDEDRYSDEFKNNLIIKRAKQALKTLNVKLEVIGFENIDNKTISLLTPNHSSSMDPALIMAALENPGDTVDDLNQKGVFLAKIELKKKNKISGYANILNTFYIDRKKPREALKQLSEIALYGKEHKKNIIVFPEGTRSKDGKINEFKAGAFRVAKQSFLSIVPVTINNSVSITNLERKGKIKVQVIFHKPLKPMSFMTSENKDIAKKVQKIVSSKWSEPEGKRSNKENTLA